jgi:RimJ/RimL family protein N-acetyltransferase
MIKGPRITLRAVTRDDLPRYVVWLNDPDVSRHLGQLLPFNLDDEIDWYEAQRKNDSSLHLAIETENNEHIGSISLMDINYRAQSAELGIVIGVKDLWDIGYGSEAIEALLCYGFENLNLNRICLRVDTDHPRAIKCYQRCGFSIEGELRQVEFRDGRFFDQYIMSVLRSEYRLKAKK